MINRDEKLKLEEAFSVLSKSSKYSVSTLRTDNTVDELQELKDHLYITPDIQTEFEGALEDALTRTHTSILQNSQLIVLWITYCPLIGSFLLSKAHFSMYFLFWLGGHGFPLFFCHSGSF